MKTNYLRSSGAKKFSMLFPVIILCLLSSGTYSQSGNCDALVPFFQVDLSSNPDSLWISPNTGREAHCCEPPDWPDQYKCVEFEVILNEFAGGLNFYVASGASPAGALYYQVNCGPLTSVNTPICLSGGGTYYITFCKPGENMNTYGVQSIPDPNIIEGEAATVHCPTTEIAVGFIDTTVVWTDITSDSGIYNSYITCLTGCDTVDVQPQAGFPAYVDYQVCGQVQTPLCDGMLYDCDTVRIYFCDNVTATVTYEDSLIVDTTGVLLHGHFDKGIGPFGYHWTDMYGNIVSFDSVYYVTDPGTYTFIVKDSALIGCSDTSEAVVNIGMLPVNLMYFDVSCNDESKNVILSWQTSSETNNDYFTVQKSTNAVDFEDIAKISGAGNSNTLLNYIFTDDSPSDGRATYYRLKQTDFDGKFFYSDSKAIICNWEVDGYTINPNPSSGFFTISGPLGDADIRIFNVNGQLVFNKLIKDQTSIDIELNTTGLHIIQIYHRGNKNYALKPDVQKIIVNIIK